MNKTTIEAAVRASTTFLVILAVAAWSFNNIRNEINRWVTNELKLHKPKARDDDDDGGFGAMFGGTQRRRAERHHVSPSNKVLANAMRGYEHVFRDEKGKPVKDKDLVKQYNDLPRKIRQKVLCIASDEADIGKNLLVTVPAVFFSTYLLVVIMDIIIEYAFNKQHPSFGTLLGRIAIKGGIVALIATLVYGFLANTRRPSRKRTVLLYSLIVAMTASGVDAIVEQLIT